MRKAHERQLEAAALDAMAPDLPELVLEPAPPADRGVVIRVDTGEIVATWSHRLGVALAIQEAKVAVRRAAA